ncbi:MAG: N-acetylneuraminate synthase family protein [Bacteroidota bacterium]
MFIISEIFPQHGGDLKTAEQMILQSKLAGADAVKVQLYTATQFGAERAYLELSFDGLRKLKEYGDRIGIDVFATPFTEERLDWCMELNLKYLKVAARMHNEMPELVEKIISKGKPTFVSVPSDYDVSRMKTFNHATYLYCIAKYPTLLDEFKIPDFCNSIFSGISDHSIGISASLFASANGAKFLEKHFTLSYAQQKQTEKAHLGAMTFDDLSLIKKLSSEFEIIINASILKMTE